MINLKSVTQKLQASHAAARKYMKDRTREWKAEEKARNIHKAIARLEEQLKVEVSKMEQAQRDKMDSMDLMFKLQDEARLDYTAHVDGASEDKARAWEEYKATLGDLGKDPRNYDLHRG